MARKCNTLNDAWSFHNGFRPEFLHKFVQGENVRLPHSAVELPLNYFDDAVYQRPFCYQKLFQWESDAERRITHLQFDGAMADAEVYLNGECVKRHRDGYTPFIANLTSHLHEGTNLIAVKIDGSENPQIPPFGGRIDYLTYAGIYRDVWIVQTAAAWISAVKIVTPNPLELIKKALIIVYCDGADQTGGTITASIRNAEGGSVAETSAVIQQNPMVLEFNRLTDIELWDLDSPVLYTASVHLETKHGVDNREVAFGFRHARFEADGFRLNGRPVKIVGLNRHQSYPYVGYAMGRRAQERDAEILKHELNCNLVRTSHYPQSPWFLDHCDRIGLLVFEEIPGWQHIGDDVWKRESLENVRRMIQRDWNHPSIVLWGVRINESADDHAFYVDANSIARQIDPTRQTAGVRNFSNSEMLEDVYTMNDFVIGSEEALGANHHRIALREQSEVTAKPAKVPYMVTEFNGHMFPTKSFDCEQRHAEHVLRYLQVLNAAFGDPHIAGCIGWCMFDYNTHQEFGAGDRICHHGVMDMFRVPKFAASVYASQRPQSAGAVLVPVTYWSRGERSIGGVLPLIILTNCDMIELRVGSAAGQRFKPDRAGFPYLPRPPVVIRSGDFGSWGMRWEDAVFTGYINNQPVAEVNMAAAPVAHYLELRADSGDLLSSEKDAKRFVVRALDQTKAVMPFLTDPVRVFVEGAAVLIGPNELALRGGTAAFWIESTRDAGTIKVQVSSPRFQSVTAELRAVEEDNGTRRTVALATADRH